MPRTAWCVRMMARAASRSAASWRAIGRLLDLVRQPQEHLVVMDDAMGRHRAQAGRDVVENPDLGAGGDGSPIGTTGHRRHTQDHARASLEHPDST